MRVVHRRPRPHALKLSYTYVDLLNADVVVEMGHANFRHLNSPCLRRGDVYSIERQAQA